MPLFDRDPIGIARIADFMGVEDGDLEQFACPICGGEGKRRRALGGIGNCVECKGSGLSRDALAVRAAEILDGDVRDDDDTVIDPGELEADVLKEILGPAFFDMLRASAEHNMRPLVGQLRFIIRQSTQ